MANTLPARSYSNYDWIRPTKIINSTGCTLKTLGRCTIDSVIYEFKQRINEKQGRMPALLKPHMLPWLTASIAYRFLNLVTISSSSSFVLILSLESTHWSRDFGTRLTSPLLSLNTLSFIVFDQFTTALKFSSWKKFAIGHIYVF